MELSKRLKTVAGAVTPGHRLADVGTDHGYVPIFLVGRQICPRAVAMDVNKGPLMRALEHVRKEELSDRIDLRLSDGLKKLKPDEVDTVVIAGMGGDLICRILLAAPEFLAAGVELVLQPQSEWFKVRHFLHDHGYEIVREWFLSEDGKYYVVIKALPGRNEPSVDHYPDEIYYTYGFLLLKEGNPVLLEYLLKEKEKKESIVLNLKKQRLDEKRRCQDLMNEIGSIDNIIHIHYNHNQAAITTIQSRTISRVMS